MTVIKGIYEDGKIILEEIPKHPNKSKVLVTFLEEKQTSPTQKRRLDSLKGKVGIPDDFNEPLDDLKDYM